jgi:thioredoxin
MGLFDKIFKKNESTEEIKDEQSSLKIIKPKNLKDDTMDKFIKDSKLPIIVDCWAEWCVPCKQLSPTIAELAGEYDGNVLVTKLNTEKNPKMAQKYSIRSIPTILYFKDGRFITRTVGALPKNSIKKAIDTYLLK